jgi:drug/metabolite transporter (DMT)-like permease
LTTAATEIAAPASRRPSSFVLGLACAAMLVMWSFNYVAGKVALRHMDGLTLASFRIPLAALIMIPFYFFRRAGKPLRFSDVWILSYLGFFLCLNQTFFTIGLAYTTSGHSGMILGFGPIIVLLLAVALKLEHLTAAKSLGMAIAFIGVALLAIEQGLDIRHSSTLAGDLFTLFGTTSFSFYVVLGKKVAGKYDSLTMNAVNLFAGAVFLAPLTLRQAMHLNWATVGWPGWAGLFYMSAFSSVAAYMLFYWVLRYMEASRVTAVNYFQPVGAIVVAAVFLGEQPTRYLLIGGALILLGVYIAERAKA